MVVGSLSGFLRRLVGQEIDTSVSLLKVEAAIAYLHVVKGTRSLTVRLCLLVFSVTVVACGFLLVPVALCLFMPWKAETKVIVAASVGAAYVIVPLAVVMSLLAEKGWMKMFQADKLVKEALKK